MNSGNFCVQCGNHLEPDAQFCPKCGTKVGAAYIKSQKAQEEPSDFSESPKSSKVTLILCLLFGMLGVHRFYVGKIWTGILMLLSVGGLGAWVLIDLILIIKNKFEDKKGRPLELTHNLSPIKETALVIGAVITWFAVCVASVSAMVVYTTTALTTALVTVVDHQLTELKIGNIEKAYSYNSNDFQKSLSIDGFRKYVDQFPVLTNNNSSSFKVRQIFNDTGFLAGTLTATDGTETPIEYRLVNQNGQWKIFNIKIFTPLPGAGNQTK